MTVENVTVSDVRSYFDVQTKVSTLAGEVVLGLLEGRTGSVDMTVDRAGTPYKLKIVSSKVRAAKKATTTRKKVTRKKTTRKTRKKVARR